MRGKGEGNFGSGISDLGSLRTVEEGFLLCDTAPIREHISAPQVFQQTLSRDRARFPRLNNRAELGTVYRARAQ